MLGAQLCVRTVSGFGAVLDQSHTSVLVANPFCWSRFPATMSSRQSLRKKSCCGFKSILTLCKSSRGRSGDGSCYAGDSDGDYVPATLLLAETLLHYRMRHQNYQEEVTWPVSHQSRAFSNQVKGPKADSGLIAHGFLRHFPSPTIFLKITCEGDFVLPIIVGDYAIEKLIDAFQGYENVGCPDQFQFMKNFPEKTGHKMEMVRITERVINTYFARLYFSKPGQDDLLSVDVRPSDAINVAYRCQVPIYVHKQIVLMDAVSFGYGVSRKRDAKPVYDVSLDSAADSPDVVAEELDLVKNMSLAIEEERYIDAAMWRDKLLKLRNSKTL